MELLAQLPNAIICYYFERFIPMFSEYKTLHPVGGASVPWRAFY
jgi:hypothetical protein